MQLDKQQRTILLQKLNNIRYDNKRQREELSYIKEDIEDNPLHPSSLKSTENISEEAKYLMTNKLNRLYERRFEAQLQIRFNTSKIQTIKKILIDNKF